MSETIKCPNCGHVNRPGVLICEQCSSQLIEALNPIQERSTRMISQEMLDQYDEVVGDNLSDTLEVDQTAPLQQQAPSQSVGHSAIFGNRMMLRLHLVDADESIVLRPFRDRDMTFGRQDPETGYLPEIDLLPYGGYRMGISRRHAALYLSGNALTIRDLGSSNGTLINGMNISPHEEYRLHDGDELRLGNMTMMVYFEDVI